MTSRKQQRSLLFIALFSLLWVACERIADPCLQPVNVLVYMGTYKPADTGTVGVDSVLPKAILGYVATGTTPYRGVKGNKFSLSLSSKSDTTKWFVSTDSTVNTMDTITLIYSRKLAFLSRSCGYTYHYELHNVYTTYNNIDSIQVKNTNIDGAANIEHVKIFY